MGKKEGRKKQGHMDIVQEEKREMRKEERGRGKEAKKKIGKEEKRKREK